MGKKRSKIFKQKIAKTKGPNPKKKKSFGGISLTTAATGNNVKRQPEAEIWKQQTPQFQKKKERVNKTTETQSMSHFTMSPCGTTPTRHPKGEDDFDRQMASMQERHQAASTKKRSQKTKQGSKKTPTWQLQPATLIVDDHHKSTSRLLDETAARVAQSSLMGTGRQPDQPQESHKDNRLQVLAAQQRVAWSSETPAALESNNPYAALDAEDDSDHDEPHASPPLPTFQFAPASFGTSTSHALSQSQAEFDPDL